jgi:hypothetical protein
MYKNEIANALRENKALHIKNALDIDIPWDDFINNVNSAVKESSDQPDKPEVKMGKVGNVRFYDRTTMVIDYANKYPYKDMHKITNLINNSGLNIITMMSIISFTDSELTTGRHFDPYSVVYVQCIGSVKWSVWDNDVQNDYVLNPGDIIFVPFEKMHEIRSLSPRTAFSFIVQ